MQKQIIILAAGKGSRMKSELPKVMHKVGNKSMLERVVDNAQAITKDLILVYSDHIKEYLPIFEKNCQFVLQDEQLGTAHAVWVARNLIKDDIYTAVIYGDNPLITPDIISGLFEHLQNSGAAVATLVFEHTEPNAYGRIILDAQGNFKKIVEYKFANEAERKITLCNSGIMAFAPSILNKYLPFCLDEKLTNQGKELYLTEIIEVCSSHGEKVTYYTSKKHELVIGVNTQEELEVANKLAKEIGSA